MIKIIDINNAKQKIKEINIIIYGTIRDISNDFFTSFTNLDIIAESFNKVHIIILENDSSDNTRQLLIDWYKKLNNSKITKHIILENNLDNLFPLRGTRLAYCRNLILENIQKFNLQNTFSYAIHCDLDDRFWSINFDSIATCFQYNTDLWDVMTCVNSQRNYYDFWALRCNNTFFNINIFSCDAKGLDYNIYISEFEDYLKSSNSLIPVQSSFNGLGIYKISSLLKGRYNSSYNCLICNNKNRGCYEDNDHIGLHKQLIKDNCKIFINPDLYIKTKPENSIKYQSFIESIYFNEEINKDLLLNLLWGNFIDTSGIAIVVGANDNIINTISNNLEGTLLVFEEKNQNQNDYLINKNVQIFYGEYEEIIPEFTNNQYISFIYINEYLYSPVKSILNSIFNKINKNTIIVFDKFINYTNEYYNALKSFYEFSQEYQIKFEWFKMSGINKDNFSFNSRIAIKIIENLYFNSKIVNVNYSSNSYINFDWINYLNNNNDLSNINTKQEAWNHWINYGKDEKRINNYETNNLIEIIQSNETNNLIDVKIMEEQFDWKSYIHLNEDLKYIKTEYEAWIHWINYGKKENRIFKNKNYLVIDKQFDWVTYLMLNEDLKNITNKEEAWDHWQKHGINEERINKFDWVYYLQKYNINSQKIINKKMAIVHWIENGKPNLKVENKQDITNLLFNWKFYINNYDDLKNISTPEEAYNHWLNYGKNEKRKCHDFKWDTYLLFNEDLILNNINSEELAIEHYINFGKNENRRFK